MKISTRILPLLFILFSLGEIFAQVAPTTQASNLVGGLGTTTSITLFWTNGNAGTNGGRIVIINTVAISATDNPTAGTGYTGVLAFGGAPGIGTGTAKVVYSEATAGTGGTTGITVTGLTANTQYFFKVFEFNATGGGTNQAYATGGATNNPISRYTTVATTPSTQANAVNFVGTGSSTSLNLKWTNGNGAGGRIVAINTAAFAGTDNPSNGQSFTGNLAYGSAPGVGSGTAKVVYNEASAGTGGTTGITVTGLSANTTYYFKVYEFDGTAGTGQESYVTANGVSNNPNSRNTEVATTPSTQASAITFPASTTTTLNLKWTKGNGTGGRILLAKTSAFVAGDLPVGGDSYTYSGLSFTGGTAIGPNGAVVVYSEAAAGTGGTAGVTVTNLVAGTNYFFELFEFDGTAGNGSESYKTTSAAGNPASRSTLIGTTPTTQANAITFAGTGSSTTLNLKWTKGNGAGGRIVVINTTAIAATDDPTNGASYTGVLAYGSAPSVGSTGAKVVYSEAAAGTGGATGITVTGLTANTTYYFKVYEFDGTAGTGAEQYNVANGVSNNPNSRNTEVATTPSTQASAITFPASTTTTLNLKWTKGNGTGGRILLAKTSAFVAGDLPVGGDSYTYSGLSFTGGTAIGPNGAVVVYSEAAAGTGGTAGVTVTNLVAGTNYFFELFEFDGTAGNGSESYKTTSAAGNPASRSTLIGTTPTTQANAITFAGTGSSTTLNLKWTKGNGAGGRIVVINTTAIAATDDPTNGASYTGVLAYGSAPSVGSTGAKVVYSEAAAGTGGATGITVTGLTANTTYYFKVYEFDGTAGTGAEQYNVANGVSNNPNSRNTEVATTPSTQASAITFPASTTTTLNLKWTKGNGTGGRILLAKTSAFVAGDLPVGGDSYTYSGLSFTGGTAIGPNGAVVVYSEAAAGTGGTAGVTVTNLVAGTNYFFELFEFDGTAGNGSESYKTTSAAGNPASRSTLIGTTPTTQANAITFAGTGSSTTLNLKWTKGNGAGGRIVVINTTAIAATDDPTNGASYTGVLAYGSAPSVGSTGAKVVYSEAAAGTGGATGITVTGLTANTTYYFKVYEFDGTAGTGAEQYNVANGVSNNPNSRNTEVATTPSTQASAITFPASTTTTLNLKWTKGNGTGGRILLAKTSAFVAGDLPVGGDSYTYSGLSFTGGTAIGPNGAVVVYSEAAAGTGGTAGVTVTNLVAGTNYFFELFEFDGTAGNGSESYKTTSAAGNPASHAPLIGTTPSTQASSITFNGSNSTTAQIVKWTKGNGAGGRVLLVKTSAFVAGDYPVNGISYTYTGLSFTGGTAVGPNGAVVVYSEAAAGTGGANGVTVTNLTAGTQYFYEVFEFDGTGGTGAEQYNTTTATGNPNSRYSPVTSASAQASNITTVTVTGSTYKITWTKGTGSGGRILLAKPTSDFVAGDYPQDGDSYSYSGLNFSAGTPVGPNGTVVVYSEAAAGTGGSTGVTITGLTSNTTYYYFVQEFDGTAGTGQENYNVTAQSGCLPSTISVCNPRSKPTTSGTTPSTQATGINFVSTGATTSIKLKWTNGNGTGGRMVVINTAAFVPATDDPISGTSYTANLAYGSAGAVGTGAARAVYSEAAAGTGGTTGITVTGLTANTTYYFKVYEFDGTLGSGHESYLTADGASNNPASHSTITSTTPSTQASAITFSAVTTTSTTLNWTNGNGAGGRLLIAKAGTALVAGDMPGNGNSYTYTGLSFTGGTPVGPNGAVIIYSEAAAGTGGTTGVNVTALSPNTTYYYQVLEFDGVANTGAESYKTTAATGNPNSQLTQCIQPTTQATAVTFGTITASSIGANWTRGNGNNVIVLARAGTLDATANPVSQTASYTANATLGSGSNIAASSGNPYSVIYIGTGTTVTATGLAPGTSYDFKVYEFNNTGNCYNIASPATNDISTNSNLSTIIENTSFTYPASIDYTQYQQSTPLPTTALRVGEFIIQDGGATLTDNDLFPTTLTNITFNITNPGNIRYVGLHDGTSIVSTAAPSGATVTFSSLSIAAADNASKTFGVYVSFNAPATDSVHFEFKIASVTAANAGSVFAFSDGAAGTGGAQTSTVASNNLVVVRATQLAYTTQPSNTLIDVAMGPSPAIKAVDALGSTDLNYTGTATLTSTGVLSTAPTATIASGVGTFSSVVHSDKGTGLTLTATLSTLHTPSLLSSTFNSNASATSDVILVPNPTFVEPSNILYANYQLPLVTQSIQADAGTNSIIVAQFRVRDGGASAPDPDAAPTILQSIAFNVANGSSIHRVAIYNGATFLGEALGGATVTFTNINGGLGLTIPDNGTADISVRVSFYNTAPAVVDNTQFRFTVSSVTATAKSSDFAAANGGAPATTIAANENRISVVATNLQFTTQPASSETTIGTVFANVPFVAPVVLEARDVNSIKDVDYVHSVNITTSGTLPMTGDGNTAVTTYPVSFVAGVLSLDPLFVYVNKGAGAPGNGTLTVNDPISSFSVLSNSVNVVTSASSDIAEYKTGFSYPTSINYLPLTASTITTPLTQTDVIKAAEFIIRDGGATLTDADHTATELTALTFTLTNASYIKEVGLFLHGTNTKVGEATVSGTTAVFTGISAAAPDNGSQILDVYVSFNSTVIDRTQFTLTITSATANSLKSGFGSGTAGGATTTYALATENQVNVIADRFNYTSIPSSGSLNVPFAPVVVQAVDVNLNVDVDFTSAVSAFSNNASPALSMLNTPLTVLPISSFNTPSNGILTLPANFQFTSAPANPATVVKLSITAGGITTQSPGFTITSSTSSTLKYMTSGFSNRIPYVTRQAASGLTTANSFALAKFRLTDGDGVTADADGAATNINSMQIKFTTNGVNGSNDIRTIALFDSLGNNLYEQAFSNNTTITFTPSSNITAVDNSATTFTIRATFNKLPAQVTDLDYIQLQLLNVGLAAGSEFEPLAGVTGVAWTKGTGAVTSSPITSSSYNKIDVVATKLDFTTQPGVRNIEGIYKPIAQRILSARDPLNLVDLEFNYTWSATAPNSPSGLTPPTAPPFAAGVLDLSLLPSPGLIYANTGNGTLSVTANGITSDAIGTDPVSGLPNVSTSSTQIDVINTYSSNIKGGTFGVEASNNLAGGSINKVIFGTTFTSPNVVGGEPKLKEFTIQFGDPSSGDPYTHLTPDLSKVFTNIRIKENVIQNQFAGSSFLSAADFTVNMNSITVKFVTPRALTASGISYFVVADVYGAANASTPKAQPFIRDFGYSDPTSVNNIKTSSGSAYSSNTDSRGCITPPAASTCGETVGNPYSFAAIFPPILTSTYPAAGQINIGTAQNTISLTFNVPVWSLDGKILLFDPSVSTTAPAATLTLDVSGIPPFGNYKLAGSPAKPDLTTLNSTLVFTLAGSGYTLSPNKRYYVTVAQASYPDPLLSGTGGTNAGIIDQAGNLYPGISSPLTFYFKTANPNPPKLLVSSGITPSGISNPLVPTTPNAPPPLTSGAILNATFDQPGDAYYVVVDHATPPANPPSVAQITANPPVGFVAYGTLSVPQDSIPTFAHISATSGAFTAGHTYDVYLYAQTYSEVNGIKSPIANGSFYGTTPSGGFYLVNTILAGAASPTFSFIPLAPTSILPSTPPTANFCSDGYQPLNFPITFNEVASSDFQIGTVATPIEQVLDIALPTGFTFDGTSGLATLTGADFGGVGNTSLGNGQYAGRLSFRSNSVLEIRFFNAGTASLDNITLSGLKILGTGSQSGDITRLGGNALPGVADLTKLATINSSPQAFTNALFTNVYSEQAYNSKTVTSIPDNYNSPALNVQLLPLPVGNDYGPFSFSGQGVNGDILYLKATPVGVPFYITATHTDNNGCVSTNTVLYTVYDHTTAIPSLLPIYCLNNPQFVPNISGGWTSTGQAPANVAVHTIPYNGLNGYYLIGARAAIPNTPTGFMDSTSWNKLLNAWKPLNDNFTIDSTAAPSFMYNGAWYATNGVGAPIQNNSNINYGSYHDVLWDEAWILNAVANSGGTLGTPAPSTVSTNPYDNFLGKKTAAGNLYWTGGLLGDVSVTAYFQSVANSALQLPITENVSFYIPAVPLVEVSAGTAIDSNDPLNLPYPAAGTNGYSNTPANKGTNVYCEGGGIISINGFPAASPGSSVGLFTIYDAATNAQITNYNPGDFVDNKNGTATLDPSKVKVQNGYKDIRIVYTYNNDNTSDTTKKIANCPTTAYQIIRISPNPVAKFTMATAMIPIGTGTKYPVTAPSPTAFCSGSKILFDASSSVNVVMSDPNNAGTGSLAYSWDFKDVSQPNKKPQANDTIYFGYVLANLYNVTLNITSFWGCPSQTATNGVNVGNIPVPNFGSAGLSYDQTYTSTSTVAGSAINAEDWDFDFKWYPGTNKKSLSGLTGPSSVNVTYDPYNSGSIGHPSRPKLYQVKLNSFSTLGCANSIVKEIMILPRETASTTQSYFQTFWTNDSTKQWQFYSGKNSKSAISLNSTGAPSWARGPVDPAVKTAFAPLYMPDSVLFAYKQLPISGLDTMWVTNLTGNYNRDEHSGLYSPEFNIGNLSRPMLSFESFIDMGTDGVVLQYSIDNLNITDPNKTWIELGQTFSGVDWFNGQGIAASPGDQGLNPRGWNGRGGSGRNWLTPKHSLDTLISLGASHVVFRWALASGLNSATGAGFAVDNFRLGSRTRTVLVENFKNLGDASADELIQSSFLTGFNTSVVGTELIKVNYDIGFPEADPFYNDNQADASARALYYNVSTPPRARLDGFKGSSLYSASSDLPFNAWGPLAYDLRSLQLAQANIQITPWSDTVMTHATDTVKAHIIRNDTIQFKVFVDPVVNLPANTVMHVGIIEESIASGDLSPAKAALVKSGETVYTDVLKKLLPNAAGTRFNVGYDSTHKPKAFTYRWMPDLKKFYSPLPNNLAIAVFLQNEDTKEVYQSEIVRHLPSPSVVTGLPYTAEQVNLYPNPANREVRIELPQPLREDASFRMMDQVGKVVHDSVMSKGTSSKTVNTSEFASGLYILQVTGADGTRVNVKVMVVH